MREWVTYAKTRNVLLDFEAGAPKSRLRYCCGGTGLSLREEFATGIQTSCIGIISGMGWRDAKGGRQKGVKGAQCSCVCAMSVGLSGAVLMWL